MSEKWDFYFFDNDGSPGSIFVDLGIRGDAPLRTHPVSGCLYVDMLEPRPDGLSSNAEYDRLCDIEDALERGASRGKHLYVARSTSKSRRDFYFYTSAPDSWERTVTDAMSQFPEYRFLAAHRSDPDWQVYTDFLHPDEEQSHSISNRHVCESLESHGDPLVKSREIDHWSYFPDQASRDEFAKRAAALGFSVRHTSEPNADNDSFGAQLFRTDVPSVNEIDGVTHPLIRLARSLGGDYDGWECIVLKDD